MKTDTHSNTTPANSNPLVRSYDLQIHYANNLQSVALLILRIGFGFGLWIAAHGHLADVPAMVQRFTEWHVPLPTFSVYVSGITEAVGGILLLLGLGTRLISIPLIINFIMAYATQARSAWSQLIFGPEHWEKGWAALINNDAMPYIVAAWVMLAFGPGRVSVDYFIKRMIFGLEPSHSSGFPVTADTRTTGG